MKIRPNPGSFPTFSGHPLSYILSYFEILRYELQGSQSSDDFEYWFINGEHISQVVIKNRITQDACLLLKSGIYKVLPSSVPVG